MTRDQERVIELVGLHPELATVLNRLCLQGMDPLSYIDLCPTQILLVLLALGASTKKDQDKAIADVRLAHVRGPTKEVLPPGSQGECLWLFLASFSQEEKGEAVSDVHSPLSQILLSLRQIDEFKSFFDLSRNTNVEIALRILGMREKALSVPSVFDVKFTLDSPYIPVYMTDLGFYKAYRTGHSVACVTHGDGQPYYFATDGTIEIDDPSLSIPLDVKITPYFGFMRPSSAIVKFGTIPPLRDVS